MALTGIAIGVIKRAIRRAYTLDISGTKTLTHLRDLGYRIQTQRFFDLRREVIASTPFLFSKVFEPLEKPLSFQRHIKTTDNFPTKFKYVLQIQGRSELSGNVYNFVTGIYSDTRLSGADLKTLVEQRFAAGGSLDARFETGEKTLEYSGSFVALGDVQVFRR